MPYISSLSPEKSDPLQKGAFGVANSFSAIVWTNCA
jgi:hypothetical protein